MVCTKVDVVDVDKALGHNSANLKTLKKVYNSTISQLFHFRKSRRIHVVSHTTSAENIAVANELQKIGGEPFPLSDSDHATLDIDWLRQRLPLGEGEEIVVDEAREAWRLGRCVGVRADSQERRNDLIEFMFQLTGLQRCYPSGGGGGGSPTSMATTDLPAQQTSVAQHMFNPNAAAGGNQPSMVQYGVPAYASQHSAQQPAAQHRMVLAPQYGAHRMPTFIPTPSVTIGGGQGAPPYGSAAYHHSPIGSLNNSQTGSNNTHQASYMMMSVDAMHGAVYMPFNGGVSQAPTQYYVYQPTGGGMPARGSNVDSSPGSAAATALVGDHHGASASGGCATPASSTPASLPPASRGAAAASATTTAQHPQLIDSPVAPGVQSFSSSVTGIASNSIAQVPWSGESRGGDLDDGDGSHFRFLSSQKEILKSLLRDDGDSLRGRKCADRGGEITSTVSGCDGDESQEVLDDGYHTQSSSLEEKCTPAESHQQHSYHHRHQQLDKDPSSPQQRNGVGNGRCEDVTASRQKLSEHKQQDANNNAHHDSNASVTSCGYTVKESDRRISFKKIISIASADLAKQHCSTSLLVGEAPVIHDSQPSSVQCLQIFFTRLVQFSLLNQLSNLTVSSSSTSSDGAAHNSSNSNKRAPLLTPAAALAMSSTMLTMPKFEVVFSLSDPFGPLNFSSPLHGNVGNSSLYDEVSIRVDVEVKPCGGAGVEDKVISHSVYKSIAMTACLDALEEIENELLRGGGEVVTFNHRPPRAVLPTTTVASATTGLSFFTSGTTSASAVKACLLRLRDDEQILPLPPALDGAPTVALLNIRSKERRDMLRSKVTRWVTRTFSSPLLVDAMLKHRIISMSTAEKHNVLMAMESFSAGGEHHHIQHHNRTESNKSETLNPFGDFTTATTTTTTGTSGSGGSSSSTSSNSGSAASQGTVVVVHMFGLSEDIDNVVRHLQTRL